MTIRELREKYLMFFESKGHRRFAAGSLIPVDVTGRLDESLLFNGAGMIQFKPYFRGVARPEHGRLITCQPCVRTNDIDEVGDDTHLSFFEMLGNFSFGDYFKPQAIALSWEFLTGSEWLNLDPKRLSFTIFENDDDAFNEWSFWITPTGLNPEDRIMRLDEESNYWPAGSFSKGPPGPCGPNSEMFYWVSSETPPSGPYSREQWLEDSDSGKWVEIWNDVFIQYEWQGHLDESGKKYVKDGMPDLPFKSIDTGMGLERTAIALGGYQSIYDTDVFQPIFAKIDSLTQSPSLHPSEREIRARRIIGDHLRTSVFCIGEGILPGNTGRGYVVRRLIRRAVLQGRRVLGFDEPFLHVVFEGLLESMGDFYTYLRDNRATIAETLRAEEILFRRTLASGTELLLQALGGDLPNSTLPGEVAFRLYDTFGFPLEVTQEISQEAGVAVDIEGYETALRAAQVRSRGGQERESVYGAVTGGETTVAAPRDATEFVGYSAIESTSKIERIRTGEHNKIKLAFDVTPFYAESGGQVGDHGRITFVGGPHDGAEIEVSNTTKAQGLYWHEATVPEGLRDPSSLLGLIVEARVLNTRRDRIKRNHTATHLLQAALRRVLGEHVTQAGSYVGPENLRFDFTHGKGLSAEEIERVERMVNLAVLGNEAVTTYVDLPIEEARAKGAMALFGEKYGDKVRMVEIGDFSRELCGGIHVRAAGEIGLFKIVSEASAASGVRRIEAVTGEASYDLTLDESRRLREAAAIVKSTSRDLVPAIERLLEQSKAERRRREKAEMAAMGGSSSATSDLVEIGPVTLWVRNFGEADSKTAAAAVDGAAAEKPNQVTVGAAIVNGKPQFFGKVGPAALSAGAHAGNLLREVAKITEGNGGGRPDFATAGGKNPAKLEEALAALPKLLAAMIQVQTD